jgi:hypothetical protein
MRKSSIAKPAAKPVRALWVVPRVDRIDAGQAEIGTRSGPDGAFTTS